MHLKFYVRISLTGLLLTMISFMVKAQNTFFEPVATGQLRTAAPLAATIQKYTLYKLKTTELRNYLAKAPLEFQRRSTPLQLDIPLPDGTVETFAMSESPILSPAVAAAHPDIKTYTGTGLVHRSYTIRLSFTNSGFDAIILGVDNDAVYYTKAVADPADQVYVTYFARDAKKSDTARPSNASGKCGSNGPMVDSKDEPLINQSRLRAAQNNTGTTLRTFRLAMAATGEFTQQKGGGNVTNAFNALVAYVNRMNAVYRVELSVAFTLVSGTNLVYPDANTDPYTNADQGKMLDENQANLTNTIGAANYDVGHILGTAGGSGGGVAVSPSVCKDDVKAQGVSGVGDGSFAAVFDDQLISHEVGHQFGMSHTFNSSLPVCTTREANTSVEPGAGTTIMSYGYTCDNATGNDNYETPAYQPFLNFHTVSYSQAAAYISTLTCFSATTLANAVPVIGTFPANTNIPKSTPFELAGTATDADANDVLSYSWEGTNVGTVVPDATTLSNMAMPPFFRSYPPVNSGTRVFPRLSAILDGTNYAKGDKLPSVGIATTHRLTVRDNVGGLSYQTVTVTVDGNSGPFLETTNLSGSYPGNSTQTITWSVNNTTAPPVSCANVNILLSTDGGLTFPTTLLANTPNDGSEPVILPEVLTSKARIKVSSSNNVFFDISNANFSITAPVPAVLVANLTANPTTLLTTDNTSLSATASGGTGPYTYAFSGPGTIAPTGNTATVSGLPAGIQSLTVTVTDATAPTNQTVTATVSVTVNAPAVPIISTDSPDPIAGEGTAPAPTAQSAGLRARLRVAENAQSDFDPGILRFQRNDTRGVLVIHYEVGGTATGGDDYVGLPGSATFVDGQSEVLVEVDPIEDDVYEGDETVIVTLIDEADYDPDPNETTATITIRDNDTPPTGTFSITGVTMMSCQTISAGERMLSFTPQYSGATTDPISFSVANEMLPTTAPGPYSLRVYTDNPTITLVAKQLANQATYPYNWLAACGTPTPPTPTGTFSITGVTMVSCQTISAGERMLSFTPQYSGATTDPISFSVANEMLPTTAPGPYSLRVYTDNPTITLVAKQLANQATYPYNWLAACTNSASARQGSSQEGIGLQVRVLGNPVENRMAEVEISGVAGQSVQVMLIDLQGRLLHQQRVGEATFRERVSVPLGSGKGVLLLQVSTTTQQQLVRLVKP
ncbi:reprolysin-like metallopeptidase [Spirosoma spitsbergense]|uniref:reprolysin-like metallopeptidase n=1 Tax=Spirosoma spitsbergense TaxID=431554 RepID=UPI0009FD001E|nr:zinc-dependent metalloprotease family protein [Spirosoma spitsbergense]